MSDRDLILSGEAIQGCGGRDFLKETIDGGTEVDNRAEENALEVAP